jgi:hypothetical protein
MKVPASQPKLSFAMAILVVMALTGCAKEDGFAPCQHDQEQDGGAKNGGGTDLEFNEVGGKPGHLRGTGAGSSISDDGDDVGDGERNKKKKPNS